MRSIHFLENQQSQRSHISNKIDGDNKESHISPDFETGDEPLEKDSLKAQISHVEAKALEEQPDANAQLHMLVVEYNNRQRSHTGNRKDQQHTKHLQMIIGRGKQGECRQKNQRRYRVDLSECP